MGRRGITSRYNLLRLKKAFDNVPHFYYLNIRLMGNGMANWVEQLLIYRIKRVVVVGRFQTVNRFREEYHRD